MSFDAASAGADAKCEQATTSVTDGESGCFQEEDGGARLSPEYGLASPRIDRFSCGLWNKYQPVTLLGVRERR